MSFWIKKREEQEPGKQPDEVKLEQIKAEPQSIAQPKPEEAAPIRTAFSAGTVIQGKLSFDTPVKIEGQLSGELFSTSTIVVGEQGTLDARCEVESLVVYGRVKGKVQAHKRIEVFAGAVLEADINTPVLVIREGAKFSGDCFMTRPQTQTPQPK